MTANTHWSQNPNYIRNSRRAIVHSGQGELHLWVSCFACARIVGLYERGATIALARELNRSVDTVEARARAAIAYRELFSHFRANPEMKRRLGAMRRKLGYSFFAEAGQRLRADVSPVEVFAQLDTAFTEGAGTKSMSGNGHVAMIELPVWEVSGQTFYDFIYRIGRTARVIILPDDYEGESVKVRL